MLGPHDRRLLLDALRPPEGYALDFAVGTTYSLDLIALLTAPLAFTMFDWQDAEGRPSGDPLATLETLRRYSDRIAVFCQAGQTLVPKQHRVLFGYLESSVFEVAAPGAQTSSNTIDQPRQIRPGRGYSGEVGDWGAAYRRARGRQASKLKRTSA